MNSVRFLCVFLFSTLSVLGVEERDSVKIYFRQGSYDLDHAFRENRVALRKILDRLEKGESYRVQRVLIIGGASPEGEEDVNKQLSGLRAKEVADYFNRRGLFRNLPEEIVALGSDWEGLFSLVLREKQIPHHKDLIHLMLNGGGKRARGETLWRLRCLHEGIPYNYLRERLFPELRVVRLVLCFDAPSVPLAPLSIPRLSLSHRMDSSLSKFPVRELIREQGSFNIALKTNMLYDLALVPNIGVEFYLGRKWSIAANWMYAWWKKERWNWWWRIYGGDVAVRKWFGERAGYRPLTGHHIGVYAQMITYDLQSGHWGYLGDRWSYAGGVEYGYSWPVSRDLRLDCTLGVGYLGGEYEKYLPGEDCYVWQATKQRHWIGPTKAEVSLVWLLRVKRNHQKERRTYE